MESKSLEANQSRGGLLFVFQQPGTKKTKKAQKGGKYQINIQSKQTHFLSIHDFKNQHIWTQGDVQ